MCAVTAGTSTPAGSVPGHLHRDGTRVPPRNGEPFAPFMPSLNTPWPAAEPLSVMKTTRVFSAMPQASSCRRSRPTLASMFSIMP